MTPSHYANSKFFPAGNRSAPCSAAKFFPLICAIVTAATFCLAASAHAGPITSYVYPLMGTRVSSDFGSRKHPVLKAVRHHNGIDLAAPKGAAIRAIRSGIVIFADPYAGYGNLIVVKHNTGMTSHYGHCDKFKVRPGQPVKAGQIIGTVGATGMVTGPHLHFEIRINGNPHDPERFIPGLANDALG